MSAGSLGDMLMILPAIHVIRKRHPEQKCILIKDRQIHKDQFSAEDFYGGRNFFSEFILYDVGINKLNNFFVKLRLLWRLRFAGIGTLYYLSPSRKTYKQSLVDRFFLRFAGIKSIIGLPEKSHELDMSTRPMPQLAQEADLILARLASAGVKVPASGAGNMNLELQQSETSKVAEWALEHLNHKESYYILGPGAMQPIKQWSIESYVALAEHLYKAYRILPIVTGLAADKDLARQIKEALPEAIDACGEFSIRESVALMKHAKFYLGNDGGGMHLAVCAGLKCVAIFSSRDFPGKWYPYGEGHYVHRSQVACEGCWLEVCAEKKNLCLREITVNDVYKSCENLIKKLENK
jgi:heptosyltransferase III